MKAQTKPSGPTAAGAPSEPKKRGRPSKKSTEVSISEMVDTAILALQEKEGSNIRAIKKYIAAMYSVDTKKEAVVIRQYLKSAVVSKRIIQKKGVGTIDRFKLAEPKKKKKAQVEKKTTKKRTAPQKAARIPRKNAAGRKPPRKKAAAKESPAATQTKAVSPKLEKSGKVYTTASPKAKSVLTPKADFRRSICSNERQTFLSFIKNVLSNNILKVNFMMDY